MSRRSRRIIAVVCVLAAAAAFVFDHSCVKPALTNRPAQSVESQNSADIQKYDKKQFTVVKVIDGDTLDIDIPDANYSHTRIRLWGVDTPETKDPRLAGPMYYGPEAADFSTKAALGKRVTIHLETGRNTRDKYNRLLAYVQLPDGAFLNEVQLPDGLFLNEVLLTEGYAYADLRFKHSLYNKYKQLESAARSQKKGLWANVTEDQLPQWLQRERPELIKKQ